MKTVGVEVETVDAAEREGVGGNLHGDVSTAYAFEFREQAQKIERFRGSVDGFEDAASQVVLDGADHGGSFATGAEDGIDEVRRGGFTVGPGDAGQKNALVGPTIEVTGGERRAPGGRAPLESSVRRDRAALAIR